VEQNRAVDKIGFFCSVNLFHNGGLFFGRKRMAFVVSKGMSITLTPEQETWIKARVATGDFASVEEAARQLIDERIAELADDVEGEHDDMAWAKPLVDEGIAALERGNVMTLEEHRARNAALRE
jgi:antitoxin ParD1/3/4